MLKKATIFLMLLILTTGCWDRREVKNLGIVNSILFDYKDDKVIFVASIDNPGTTSGSNQPNPRSNPPIYIMGEGDKIMDAINNSTLSFDKFLYVAHLKAVFFTERFAREKGINDVLDLILRWPEYRQNEYMVVVKGDDASELYKSTTDLSSYTGEFVEQNHNSQQNKLSKSAFVDALTVTKDYYNDGKQIVMGTIMKVPVTKEENRKSNPSSQDTIKDNTKLRYEGLAIFKKDKLKYILDGEGTENYNLIMGNLKAIDLDVDGLMFHNLHSDSKIITSIKKDQVSIKINLNLELMVTSDKSKHDLPDMKTIEKLQKKVNDKLEKRLQDFMKMVQQNIGIDFFYFGNVFHYQNCKEWKKIKDDWEKYFKNANIKININSSISTEGKIKRSKSSGE